MAAALQIQIASDIVCPWCYIGKRRLETALGLFAAKHPDHLKPHVSWLAFQLNPNLPPNGMSRADYLERKFGSPDGGGMYERVRAEGRKEGIEFNFAAIKRQPNTLRMHALLAVALKSDETAGLQERLKEALMRTYFCEGADLTQDAALIDVAKLAGMSPQAARAALSDTVAHEKIASQDAELRRIGISGVPFFIVNRQMGISGAQSAEALLVAMGQAADVASIPSHE